jgi:hypothetical protein
MMSTLKGVTNPWTSAIFLQVLVGVPTSSKALSVLSIIMGITTLNQYKYTWRLLVVFFGIHIAVQVPQLTYAFQNGWISLGSILINFAAFIFLASQLNWTWVGLPKPKSSFFKPEKAPPLSEALTQNEPVRKNKKILVRFDGIGAWARLINVSNKGMLLRNVLNTPVAITDQPIELQLSSDLILLIKLSMQRGADYHFEFLELSHSQATALNQWLAKS